MMLYHAIKEVDENEKRDLTAAELIRLIGQNCHTIVADKLLVEKYSWHLTKLLAKPPLLTQTSLFLTQIIANSSKFVVEEVDPPELPPNIKIPREDAHVVRAALISHPIIVTAERALWKAINSQSALGLEAKTPAEALELAKQE